MMAFSGQIPKLISRLTELTKEGKVAWQETPKFESFMAPVGDFVITISKGGSALYGGYSLEISDHKARTVDTAVATFVGPERDSAGHANWQQLKNLHDLARRSALNSDQAVSELLSSLEQIR